MNILITGATGLIGSHLLKKINLNIHKVAILVRNTKKANEAFRDIKHQITMIDGSESNFKKDVQYFNPDMVIHLASYLTSKHSQEDLLQLIDANITFSSLLLDALSGTNIQYFINTGSCSEYYNGSKQPDGAYLYSAMKIAYRAILEFYSKINHFNVLNVIPYTVYGSESLQKKALDLILDSLESRTSIYMTEGSQIMDLIHIEDVIDYYIHVIGNIESISKQCTEFHLGTGQGISIKELASKIEGLTGLKANISWGAIPFRKRDVMYAVAPIECNYNGWHPHISLDSGLKKIIAARKP